MPKKANNQIVKFVVKLDKYGRINIPKEKLKELKTEYYEVYLIPIKMDKIEVKIKEED